MEIEEEAGEKLVKLARTAVENHFKNLKTEPPAEFSERRGVFVTIHKYPSMDLRGCIGFVEPIFPLGEAVIKAALNAAFNDPRFLPLEQDELEVVVFEVSVLSKPQLIEVENPKEYLEKIKEGDGLILRKGLFSGVFLPQVWELIKGKEDFLNALCEKAGLPHGSWLDKDVKIYKFNVVAFAEERPYGKVRRVI